METWLKGGLIGAIIGVLILVLTMLNIPPFSLILYVMMSIMGNPESAGILSIIAIPVIFAIIGAIIGKLKSK